MVAAHKYLNGSRDLTTPLSGIVRHPGLALAKVSILTKFEVSNSINYESSMCPRLHVAMDVRISTNCLQ